MTQHRQPPIAPWLLISTPKASRTVDPDGGPIVIGRDPDCDLSIDHPMISRAHARVEVNAAGQWTVADTGSRNGLFVDGERRETAVIDNGKCVRLGNPTDGIELRFAFVDSDRGGTTEYVESAANQRSEAPEDDSDTDPSVKAAGAAVRARREELGITQRGLAADGIVNASALIAFEKGRSWPRMGTQEKLEATLHWPRGTIGQIRSSYWSNADPDGKTTTLTDTGGEAVLMQAIATGVNTIEAAINDLPAPQDPRFSARLSPLTANLRQLEALAGNAATDSRATPTTALTLAKIRLLNSRLIALAAQSPTASLGQRLLAARRRCELSEAETAAAANVPAATINAIESGQTVPAETASKVAALIALLDQA